MKELLEYIDNYFNGQLAEDEKKFFEKRCETDEVFAEEVALYISSREALRSEVLAQKRKEWKSLDNTPAIAEKGKSAKVIKMKPWYWIAAAASILIIFFLLVPFRESPQQMADKYIDKNLKELSVLMNGAKDSLQWGIQTYNEKDYGRAGIIFKNIYSHDSSNTDALQYEGLAYLMKKDYDNAVKSFGELSAKNNLFSNPGLFYMALTLLKRNKAGDVDEARNLLNEIVDKKMEGEMEAEKLLENL